MNCARPANHKPLWLRQEIPDKETLDRIGLIKASGVNTVCESAHCPNISECFKSGKLTFMILGKVCTRHCRFCAVGKGEVLPVDKEEPERVARKLKELGIKYAVVTSVTRDDLVDGGADVFAQVIKRIRETTLHVKIEVLIPDFAGDHSCLRTVAEAGPDCLGHNIETVERLYPQLRPEADYKRSLTILARAKKINGSLIIKSSLMLGLGESEEEVLAVMRDLLNSGCDCLTLGQYLSPSSLHYPVKEFVAPETFDKYKDIGLKLGFKEVLSGPKVRSSYRAEELYLKIIDKSRNLSAGFEKPDKECICMM